MLNFGAKLTQKCREYFSPPKYLILKTRKLIIVLETKGDFLESITLLFSPKKSKHKWMRTFRSKDSKPILNLMDVHIIASILFMYFVDIETYLLILNYYNEK